jgi:anaerobic selenocysteine-containing dehydrogenase
VREAQKRGARLVVVDPRETPLARQADLHLAPRPGTDVAIALAIHRYLFEEGFAASDFLDQHAAARTSCASAHGPGRSRTRRRSPACLK